MVDVSIVIVNYNNCDLLYNCLISIFKFSENIKYEIIISDNGSTDESLAMLRLNFPNVIIIENKVNLGFGAANNKGACLAQGKYILFLNSDTRLLNNAVGLFFSFADLYKCSILGGYLLDDKENIIHSHENFSSPGKTFIRLVYLSFPALYTIKKFIAPKKIIKYDDVKCQEVQYVTGADLFIRRDVFISLNGFDEKFFMYFEDDDLCRRANQKGYKAYVIPGPKIIHLEGKSSNTLHKIAMKETSFFIYNKKYMKKSTFQMFKMMYRIYTFIRLFSLSYTISEKKELLLSINRFRDI
jgi:GT2 family glycosyltransferase